MGVIDSVLGDFRNYLELAQELKQYCTPEYRESKEALEQIINKILEVVEMQTILVNKIIYWNFNKNEDEFREFSEKVANFRDGRILANNTLGCHEINEIYEEKLASRIKKWLAHDRNKLEKAERIFGQLSDADFSVDRFMVANTEKLKKLTDEILKDYSIGRRLRDNFNETDKEKDKLIETRDKLVELAKDFRSL